MILRTPGLLIPSTGYKPFRYPWAFDFWKRQQQIHWLPEEVPMCEDCRDWSTNLTEVERNLLVQVFRFFTQSDVEVNENYVGRYGAIFKPVEVQMMLCAFSNMETVHINAYALLLETIGMPESEFSAFLEYSEMSDKHDYFKSFNVDDYRNIAKTLAMFAAFAEGLQLFASFIMLLNFPRFNKMKGMGQIVAWSVRDESLHCEGMIRLFHAFVEETQCYDDQLKSEIYECARTVIAMEDRFIDLAFEMGSVEGMNAEDIKAYIRYIANWRLSQLKLDPLYSGLATHPLPWVVEILNGVEHANFFETRATDYAKGATTGSWSGEQGAWSLFDQVVLNDNLSEQNMKVFTENNNSMPP